MIGYQELNSRRGRLYYRPPSHSDTVDEPPLRDLRSRASRQQLLQISRRSIDFLVPDPSSKRIWEGLAGNTLVKSRDQAKRLLRYWSVPAADPPSATLVRHNTSTSLLSGAEMTSDGAARGSARSGPMVGGPMSGMIHRPSLVQDVRRDSANSVSSNGSGSATMPTVGEEKPIASGNGVSLSIALAEPVLFLQGMDQTELGNQTTTMLRGTFHLRVSKSAKIKAISLAFRGRAETDWPEGESHIRSNKHTQQTPNSAFTGIPPRKTEFKDRESIMNHTWTFFNAQFQTAEYGTGADFVKPLKGPIATTTEIGVTDSSHDTLHRRSVNHNVSAKDAKKLSLAVNQSRSFGKDDRANGSSSVAQKGYRMFTPGDYSYNFELPIDSRLPETISVDLGSVKYELEATVERAGAFRANLIGSKEVTLIRAPAEGSLEQVEPIAISRNWEDQLHYDIVISGKSFPLGAQVPIAFKLTPLAKVQCHRIKVFVTENIQYYTTNKRVHRLEPTRKIQLFEKRADAPSSSTYPGSSVRITAGGGVAYDGRAAAARGDESVPRDSNNLLGNLEGEHNVGPTEMEFNVQLPSCHNMRERDKFSRLNFDTTYQGIQVHHWIKVGLTVHEIDQSH